MAFYQFTQTRKIPASIEEVWAFISNPFNLKQITPNYMDFKVISNSGSNEMHAGMIITYNVRPLLGIPMKWMTEITHVKDKEYFVDEQCIGPYKMWHYQHKIEAIDSGVLMTDIVTYIPLFGFIGAIANSFIIKKQLKEIFDFRVRAIEELFGVIK